MRQLVTLAQQAAPGILRNREIQHGGKTYAAQHPQRILFEALLRVANTADHAELKIPLPAEGVNPRAVKAAADGIDRKVTAAEILPHIPDEDDMLRAPVIGIAALRPVGRHFQAVALLQHRDRTMRQPGRDTARKQGHDLLRQRGGSDVDIMHRTAQQLIAQAAADEISLMAACQQACNYSSGSFGHAGWCHSPFHIVLLTPGSGLTRIPCARAHGNRYLHIDW
ncbi:hypothetical protein MHH28_10570 [Paenibacillus sp. FSL K6-1217]